MSGSAGTEIQNNLGRLLIGAAMSGALFVSACIVVSLIGHEVWFRHRLPPEVASELSALEAKGLGESPRGIEIYVQYRPGVAETTLALSALALALAITLLGAYLASRRVSRRLGARLDNLAYVAREIALGRFGARAAEPPSGWAAIDAFAEDFNAMAAALATMQRDYLTQSAIAAHELRTPLAVIRAEIEALRCGVAAWNADTLDSLDRQSRTLGVRLEDLRACTLAAAGQLTLHREAVDLEAMVAEITRAIAKEHDAGSRLILALHPARVRADARRMRQMIENLFVNALRHAHAPYTVSIAIHANGELLLTFADSGPVASHAVSETGSGLGLRVVDAICEAHGLRAEQTRDTAGGTRMTIVFPRDLLLAPETAPSER